MTAPQPSGRPAGAASTRPTGRAPGALSPEALAYAKRCAAEAPPLTAEQEARIAAIFAAPPLRSTA